MADSNQSVIAQLMDKHRSEGHELVEYALISAFVSIGVALLLSGFGQQFAEIWNYVATLILR